MVLYISSTFNPLILIPVIGAGLWLILSTVGEKGVTIPEKYRIHLTFILTAVALLSILLLSKKVIVEGLGYLSQEHSPLLPPIVVVSTVTIFVAVTTYIKKLYPYSAIFEIALLGVIYSVSLQNIIQHPMAISGKGMAYFIIPLLIIASSLWRHEKLGTAYPIAYAAVFGVVAGVALPSSSEDFGFLGMFLLIIVPAFFSGIAAVISFVIKSRSKSANEIFLPALKMALSLVVFLIVLDVAFDYIFLPFYRPRGFPFYSP